MFKPRLAGKTAVVTGVASGIGRAVAKMFAEEGAKVVGCDYDRENGQKTIDDINAGGGDALFVPCDLRIRGDIARVREEAVARYGRVTTLVNAAGVVVLARFMDQTDRDMQMLFETNYRGAVWMMREFLPELVASGQSSVTNIASISVYQPESYAYYYGSFKAAIAMLTRNLAREYTPQGVRLNVICPGPCDTGMTPETCRMDGGDPEMIQNLVDSLLCDRVGAPEDIAYCATYLASDEAAWITASQFTVDGGASFGGGDHFKL
jgi:NAD(P)-dependent dehydrogenase (short-subunit alcohol dehydrogenase family)